MKPEHPAADQIPQLRQLWQLAFGDSEEFIHLFFSTAYDPRRCRLITLEGRTAAALYWFDVHCCGRKMAYIYAVATHPDFQNRGLCRRLMADTHALLAELGYTVTLLVPGEPRLREMYAKMGYQNCGGMDTISCTAAKTAVPLRPIDKEEYAALRRNYLPEGGVIQERENLSYLETFAQFYAGEDFLLTAAPDGPLLNGIELLGNTAAAPGILTTLGYASGTFRIPGEAPFAMFRQLADNAEIPTYFGIAFD